MHKIFTPIRLVVFTGILASTVLAYNYSYAQSDDKDKKKTKTEKRIEIVDENGQKKVTVTTIENGNKTWLRCYITNGHYKQRRKPQYFF